MKDIIKMKIQSLNIFILDIPEPTNKTFVSVIPSYSDEFTITNSSFESDEDKSYFLLCRIIFHFLLGMCNFMI